MHSDLAQQTLKDPYNFSFLTLERKFREKDLEQGLIDHIRKSHMEKALFLKHLEVGLILK